ncbi:MAG: family 65 glycosyl hydrolase domain-containing protein [Clostridiaceae bacterium]
MKNCFLVDEWNIIEDHYNHENNMISESILSLGNGHMGMRGNFEEDFSGKSLKGTYIAGVYYPDKTRVGWWKNGYPEYFAKVLNAVNFIGIKVKINGEILDIESSNIKDFKRQLNMKEGSLNRSFTFIDSLNRETKIEVKRFLSMKDKEIAAISYSLTPINHDSNIELIPYLDGNIYNQDSNYDEMFWNIDSIESKPYYSNIKMTTKKLDFLVFAAMGYDILLNNNLANTSPSVIKDEKLCGNKISMKVKSKEKLTLNKYIAISSNRYYDNNIIDNKINNLLSYAKSKGFTELYNENVECWDEIWKESDIVIKGDARAQQAIRFNIFQLNQTYTGDDTRLNIGPKGFTGEKYGGSTYWDTEAYCLPFYLSTRESAISKNLLIYRYNQLDKAVENAKKLGLSGALYPMVTMNGEECHNEWEITFEEIHRNGAIAYAIYNYINYTNDLDYLPKYGLEVLIQISRFWASRVNYNKYKDNYMILGVTGPNEYENNVNNNWYTNTMAAWCLEYTIKSINLIKEKYPSDYKLIIDKLDITDKEILKWQDITNKMYFPFNKIDNVFEQQDGYMDKEQLLVKDINPKDLPLNKNWSWDKILRSPFIKQADILQGIYFLGDKFDIETKKRNFDFYEPRTVHESSLSPCIYSIIASQIGYHAMAYKLYLRTARLDLDNYNKDTDDGLHITSMAGSWMSIVHGFGGLNIKDSVLCLNPFIPTEWDEYSFKLYFREHLLNIKVSKNIINIIQEEGSSFKINVLNKDYYINSNDSISINY